jgi:hypothetical protein
MITWKIKKNTNTLLKTTNTAGEKTIISIIRSVFMLFLVFPYALLTSVGCLLFLGIINFIHPLSLQAICYIPMFCFLGSELIFGLKMSKDED